MTAAAGHLRQRQAGPPGAAEERALHGHRHGPAGAGRPGADHRDDRRGLLPPGPGRVPPHPHHGLHDGLHPGGGGADQGGEAHGQGGAEQLHPAGGARPRARAPAAARLPPRRDLPHHGRGRRLRLQDRPPRLREGRAPLPPHRHARPGALHGALPRHHRHARLYARGGGGRHGQRGGHGSARQARRGRVGVGGRGRRRARRWPPSSTWRASVWTRC